MKGSILWKVIATAFLLVWSVWSILPLQDRDFGTHLREQVRADKPAFEKLLQEAEKQVRAKEKSGVFVALRDLAKERGVELRNYFPQIKLEATLGNTEKANQIVLETLLRDSKSPLPRGLDLKGGVSFVLEAGVAPPGEQHIERQAQLSKAIEIISARVNGLGVTEPVIRQIGENRIEVQLPGLNVRDNPDVINVVKKPALLEFRMVHPNLRPTGAPGEDAPPGYEVLFEEREGSKGEPLMVPQFVAILPEMTGKGVAQAYPMPTETGTYYISLAFTDEGKKQFGEVTTEYTGRLMGIVLDGKLYSAPRINEPITGGQAQITGRFSQREAVELANVLNNPLDVPLSVVEMTEVGPSLAGDAISSGVTASIIGATLVVAFMLVFYFSGGLVAVLSLAFNVLMLLGAMAGIHATLTMPGIAGIVLTIGMAVDSNILIFERIREEMASGKSLKAAFAAGHERAFTTIVDANLTTLISGLIMILMGKGPVIGFGVTLTIGIFTTMFATLIVAKLVLEWMVNYEIVKRLRMMPTIRATSLNFMRWAKPAFIVTWIVVLTGAAAVFIKGREVYGIDFVGGDEMILTYESRPAPDAIAKAATAAGVREYTPLDVAALGGGKERLKLQTPEGQGQSLVEALKKLSPQSKIEVEGENRIGATVGREIQINAILSILLSVAGIMVYVAFRFEMGFGLGAVVSTLHDVLMTIGIFVLFGYQFSAPMVAAILLIVGYSINDTIVVFDRIREELALNPDMKLREVINLAINRTLARTILTGTTTFLCALALFVFGTGVIVDLSFTFLVGIVTGTFSSVFVASPIFYWYHKGDRKKLDGEVEDETPKYEWSAGSKAAR